MVIPSISIDERKLAINSVLELFRRADAIRINNGQLLTGLYVTEFKDIDPDRHNDVLVLASWYDATAGLKTVGFTATALEAFSKRRDAGLNKQQSASFLIEGQKICVEFLHTVPFSAHHDLSRLAKSYAAESLFVDLMLDAVSLYDELSDTANIDKLEDLFENYELTVWKPFESYSPTLVVHYMIGLAHKFDDAMGNKLWR